MAPLVADFAKHFHANVTLLHVLPANPLDAHRTEVQEDLNAFAWPSFAGICTCQAIAEGDPATAILAYARQHSVDLIMMPTHGFGPFRRFLLGSVAEKVLRDAPCPVWTDIHGDLRPHEATSLPPQTGDLRMKSVVCAIDLSEGSRTALRWAADFARDMSAKLTIVHAIARAMPTPELPVDWTPQIEEAAREQLDRLQASEGTHAETRVVTGEIAHAVHDAVEDAHGDLLVIGRNAEHGAWARMMDHAYPIVSNAPCPVVSV
jgi:nucleotide-binding universal stress UspA family protein